MSNDTAPTRLAGLPPGIPQPAHDARAERLSIEFTLPESVSRTLSWQACEAPAGWLKFRMSELTPQDQADAVRLAGTPVNPANLTMELVCKTLVSVSGEPVRGNRDLFDRWWRALGPRGRKLVEAAFMQLSAPTEEEVATFLGTGKP